MSKRPAPTLADYAVIAISPALIIALVGSLVFYLIEVFYRGNYDSRLSFIMAMFVMAAVLIARISIERGREHALLFAIPLGVVTAIATIRFVRFSGPLEGLSAFINIGLIALVWWCADKLTWDSTVIDESQDASGEGLLQTVGLESEQATAAPGSEPEATTAREVRPLTFWQRFVEQRRRPHAPGVWVIYFSLAALPIFGFGNWFIPSSDVDSRRYVFKLLVVYVASALGLLLTTSFLGLRRYLRQRRLEMPLEMAGSWMGIGAALIVALLLFCAFLPRRNPEYSVTELPIFAGSPDDLWTTEYAVGNEGQEDPENADRSGEPSQDPPQPQSQEQGKGSAGGEQHSSGDQSGQGDPGQSGEPQPAKGEEQGEPGENPQEQHGADGSGQGGRSPKGQSQESDPSGSSSDQGQEQQGQGPNAGGQNAGGQQGGGQQSQPKPSDGQQPADSKGDSGEQPRQSDEDQPKSPDGQPGNDQRKGGGKQPGDKGASPGERGAPKEPSEQPKSQLAEEQQKESDKASKAGKSGTESQPRATKRFNPSKIPSALGGTLGRLLKLLYWVAIIAFVSYVGWRYRREIVEALRNFLQALRDFWASLFGQSSEPAAEAAAAAATAGPPPKPFSSFPDPFLTGMAQQRPPAEVIRYSFDAFEAWAREHGYPRGPEQTPHEYAQLIGQHQATLARDALTLAELYARCAYSNDPAPRSSLEHLRRLWEQLRATAA